jgi:malonate transporter MadL subunit
MIVYGVAILSACVIVGKFIGDWLGIAIGVQANVGGVGIAMLLLVAVCHRFDSFQTGFGDTALGISFWSAMYIPIIVAMAAMQNVLGALTGGPVALAAGLLAVLASFALVPLLSGPSANDADGPDAEGKE